jgi:hypothetical protein
MSDAVEETPDDFVVLDPITIRIGARYYHFGRTPYDTLVYVNHSPVIDSDDDAPKEFDPSEYR